MYHITLFDGTSYEVPDSAAESVKAAMKAKEMIEVGDSVFSSTAIKKFEKANRYGPENTSQLSLDAAEVFALEDGIKASPDGFWKTAFLLNKSRLGKFPWYYARAVEWGKRQSGMSEPAEIFAFLDSEPELTKARNVPQGSR